MGELKINVLVFVLVCVVIVYGNMSYEHGYKIGQIHALSNNIKYQLTTNKTSEVKWTEIRKD